MQFTRRFALAALAAAATRPAWAQSFPGRPLRMVVPFPPGGPVDTVARLFGQQLGEALGQAVVVDNRAGAGGTLGSELVAKAPADGYTLLFGSNSTLAVSPTIYKNLSYEPVKSFQPIAGVARGQMLLLANPDLGIHSLRELVAYAKANPAKLNYSSPGNGTTVHLAIELFKREAGIRALHIPYRGGAPSLNAVIAGEVQFTVEPEVSALSFVKAGRLRPLAVMSPSRSARFPDLPNMKDAGYAAVNADYWMGVVVPAGTPRTVVDRLYAEVQKIGANAAFAERVNQSGSAVAVLSPDELSSAMQSDMRRWADVVKQAGITAD